MSDADRLLTVEVIGLDPVLAQLATALQRIERPADLMEGLGNTLAARIQMRFATKRDPDGAAWAPLAASTRNAYDKADTVRRGKRAGQVVRRGTLLQRTGLMLQSLSVNATADSVEVGMSRLTDKGGWQIPWLHETGTRRGMPRRGIFFSDWQAGTLGAGDEAALGEELQVWLGELFG